MDLRREVALLRELSRETLVSYAEFFGDPALADDPQWVDAFRRLIAEPSEGESAQAAFDRRGQANQEMYEIHIRYGIP